MAQNQVVIKTNLHALILKKSAQKHQHITQRIVASATGLSTATVSRWVSGKISQIDGETLAKFCEYFECSICDVISGYETVVAFKADVISEDVTEIAPEEIDVALNETTDEGEEP